MALPPLPIDEVLPRLIAALRERRSAVLRAPTGSGKTTRVPPAILDAGIAGGRSIVMLEPRRLAARAAARRIASERGGEVGGEIGFQVRFERRASRATRILVVTEGLFLRRLQDDPFLDDVGAVVFDEFHERNLESDLALALVARIRAEARPDLALVVMSATLATAEVAAYLDGAPVVESDGRLHPVAIEYLGETAPHDVTRALARGVELALERAQGDVLAFLPGVGEIERARRELEPLAARRGLSLSTLYGDLPAHEQDAVLRRSERRKIVLATNVAETSVTIEGIGAVVDSGLVRTLSYDPSVGLDRLVLGRISRASADQRAGRAGRTQAGSCLRLWSEREQRSLAEREEPAIRRVDLAAAVLELACFGERDLDTFPWFEKPPPAALERARRLLERLDALDAHGPTRIGRKLVRLPLHPRLARLVLAGHESGSLGHAVLAAALLAERDPFRRERARGGAFGRTHAAQRSDSDVLDRVIALEAWEHHGARSSTHGEIEPSAASFVLRAADALARDAESALGPARAADDPEAAFLQSLFVAYPDRLARRRERGSARGVLAGGRGVRLGDESSVLDAELFVCVDVDAGKRGELSEALVRQASLVERDWLPPERLVTEVEVVFDPVRERVVASRRTRYDDLVIEEAQVAPPDDETSARVLAEAAARAPGRALDLESEAARSLLARVRSLRTWMPELELPALDEASLAPDLAGWFLGCRSFEETRALPLAGWLASKLTRAQQAALDREAPERVVVPSGSSIRLEYPPGRAPVLAVRIQEIFGLARTPRVAGGRVPVVMHLLAPNHRPQQVTEDLASFWKNAYPEIRRELARRYPRHAWPEDPSSAPPEKRPKPRRR